MQQKNELFRLSWQLAVADFKLRNEGSYLGNLWYVLNPLLLFLLLFLVFFDRLGVSIESYPAYLIIGILIFNFFLRTTMDATGVIRGSGFIKSINFPREALVLGTVIKNLFSHLFEVTVFFVILFFLGIPAYGIFPYLLLLVFLSVFVYGAALFLSALAVYVIDLQNIWQFFTTLLLFATPIFYAIEGQNRLFMLNLGNPLYYFITAARDSVVYANMPDPFIIAGVIVAPVISLTIGHIAFRSLQHRFAEMV